MSTPDLYRSSQSHGGGSRSASVSASFDYSQLDEQDKMRQAVDALDAKKFQSLYEGDVAGAMAIGKQQRGLLSALAKPASVRLSSGSARASSSGPTDSEGYRQVGEDDDEGPREPRDTPEIQTPRPATEPQEPTEGLIMPKVDMNMNPVAGLRPKKFRPYV